MYQEKEIDDDMVILKTVIENNGRKDIDKQIVYEPMTIEFKDPIELLEVEVLQAPNEILATKNNNSVVCNWDLLKRKEFIVLKLLLRNKKNEVQLKSNELLNKYSYIHFRITDLLKAKKINYTKSVSRKVNYTELIQPSLFLVLSLFIILHSLFMKPFSIRYQDTYFEGKYYSMTGGENDNIILKCDKEKKKCFY